MGTTDKVLRITIAVTLLVLLFDRNFSVELSVFFFLFAMLLIGTVLNGNCPAYKYFRINTNKNLNDKARNHARDRALIKNYLKNYYDSFTGIEKSIK